MKVRLAAKGWEKFSGNFGFQAQFKDGVSVNDLTPRQIARIGSTTLIVCAETGVQVGPAQIALLLQGKPIPVAPAMQSLVQRQAEDALDTERVEAERRQLADAEKARKAEEAAALEEARRKAEDSVDEVVIYTRDELEAIASNNGIAGLRDIAKPLGVRARAIKEMIDEILEAQNKKAVA